MSPGPELHVVDRGEGSPALVSIHGLSGSLRAWAAQIDAPWPGHRVVAVDMPGHGKSPPLPHNTVASVAASIRERLVGMGVQDLVLVAHSMGCRVAAEMLHQSPAGVRGVVFIDGSLSVGDPVANLQRWERFIQETEALAQQKGRDPRATRELWNDYVHWDATCAAPALRSIRVPVLLIQATSTDENRRRHRLGPEETTPWTELVSASVQAGCVLERVRDSGHFIMRDQPQQVTQLLAGFVARLA